MSEASDQRNDAMAYVTSLKAEVESLTVLLHKEASAHARTLGNSEKYKRLLGMAMGM